jgi:hypothetical protein
MVVVVVVVVVVVEEEEVEVEVVMIFYFRCSACVMRPSALWLTCMCGGDLIVKHLQRGDDGSNHSASIKDCCCSVCGAVPSDSRLQKSLRSSHRAVESCVCLCG